MCTIFCPIFVVSVYIRPMFEQLDLFGQPVHPSPKPEKGRGRLVPPAVIEAEPLVSVPDVAAEKSRPGDQPIAVITPTVFEENLPGEVIAEEVEQAEMAEDPSETASVMPAKSGRGRKSIQEMSREAALLEIPEDSVLFSKQYYGIGEVAAMFHVNASLLRFWEAEFSILKPRKNKKGDRFFRPEDIKNLQLIHHLLRERKYTIEGARDFLRKSGRRKEQFEAIESLKKIRAFLVELKTGI